MQIRPAKPEDATAIADYILLAMQDLAFKFSNNKDVSLTHDLFQKFIALPANQYSYENTLVAEEQGKIIGAIIGYDGGKLEELRTPFVEYIRNHCGFEGAPEDETEEGEVYLDTLAVYPQHRGKKVGQRLIEAFIEQSREKGFSKIGLLVDPENPHAKRLYERVGFKVEGLKPLLGTTYEHMVYEI